MGLGSFTTDGVEHPSHVRQRMDMFQSGKGSLATDKHGCTRIIYGLYFWYGASSEGMENSRHALFILDNPCASVANGSFFESLGLG